MSKHSDIEKIIKYIRKNPNIGRDKIAKMFKISDRMAGNLKWSASNQYPTSNVFPEITDKDVAHFLKTQKGLSVDSVLELLSPEKSVINNFGDYKTHEFTVGLIADTHNNDKACALDELHDFYKQCKKAGVKHVLHSGDITAGVGVYRGQEFDLTHHGFNDQLNNLIETYPKIDGITTHVISGNHDESFTTKAGANFVESLSLKRDDVNFLGVYAAQIVINGVTFGLQHGESGNCVQVSYKAQKYIDRMGAGTKPQVWSLGHYHTALSMLYRNIHVYMPGCFQKPNNFSMRKGLPNMIGGYIVHLKVADDEHRSIKSIKSELIAYYD